MTDTAGALLTIDLSVIRNNYKILTQQHRAQNCAAVVKADGYGLGMVEVSKALWKEGARTFFVAQINEAIKLRASLPDADIHVLCGNHPNTEAVFAEHNLVPVLNSLDQIKRWQNRGRCDVHVDTGMTRLGLALNELDQIPKAMELDIFMTHFACADETNHSLNQYQINTFGHACEQVTFKRASLANSSGLYLSPVAHHDLARPGCALYGVNPTPGKSNPVANPVRLQGKVIQIHRIDTQESVGYGATHALDKGQRLATICLGYADGYLRSLSSKGSVFLNEKKLPVVGRVSMDLISVDITSLGENDLKPGDFLDVIGPHNPPDDLAEKAGTIGYEILTSLGQRYQRAYLD